MITPVRLVTVHPALVHFTVGILPVIVFAYLMAVWLNSERWSFAGDVATGVCAAITLVTVSFGLISNFYLRWPGGVGFWRYLHMGFGVGSMIMLVAFATTRLMMRQRGQTLSGIGTLAVSIFIAIFIGATSWIGGEVLVYTAGMAVAAAGNGALGRVGMGGSAAPVDFPDAMGQARASWGSITTQVAEMIVHHPTDEGFANVAGDARHLQQVAHWISTEAPKRMPRANQPMDQSSNQGDGQGAGKPMTRGQMMAYMGAELETHAQTMARLAQQKDLKPLANEVGATGALCTGCHEEFRWRRHGG